MHAERLLKLAQHLETGKLGHDGFDFKVYHDEGDCGTVGCAIGECPTVFPDDWEIDRHEPVLRGYSSQAQSAMNFFFINRPQYHHLFVPNMQKPSQFGGVDLDGDATKEQVAANIRSFVAKKLADSSL